MSRPSSFWEKLDHSLKAKKSNDFHSSLKDERVAEKTSADIVQVLCRTLRTRRPELLTILLDDHQLFPKIKRCLVTRHSRNPIMEALIAGQKIGNHPPGPDGVDSDVSEMVTKLLDTIQHEPSSIYGKVSSGQRDNFILNDKVTGYGNSVAPAELAYHHGLEETASILKRRTPPSLT